MTWWEKTKAFCKEHKMAIVAVLSGLGGAIGGALIFKASMPSPVEFDQKEPVKELPMVSEVKTEDDWSFADPMLQTIVNYENKAEEGGNHWFECERQRRNWDMINKLAEELKPGDFEYYIIEGTNPDCNTNHVRWFVHHWQDDFPSYPPEVVQERFTEPTDGA